MGSLSIADVIKVISDDKSLVLFNTIALASGDSDILRTTVKLTRKQYYSRMSGLVNAGLVTRKNRNYFVTSFGKIVYDAQLMIGKAVESYWKLKALDSFELSSSARPQLPAEEYNRVIDTLMDGNDEIKGILHRYNNKNDITVPQKEKVYTQQLISSRISYE
ncbi:MAG: hypothetical protein DLM72_14210 [Candidatus Nitrosopolaris wilkensis]|nr:MAG: hypothetical protein DLM72_14210 [Candidatus Nitrosopolaris wilkensis]